MELHHIESVTNRVTGLLLDKFDSVPGLVARSDQHVTTIRVKYLVRNFRQAQQPLQVYSLPRRTLIHRLNL
jgi:hypothetical protein